MKRVPQLPIAHLLVCTNERPDGKSCCKKVGGQEFFLRMKEELTQRGLRGERWVTRTGCLGFCNDTGCVTALYRRGNAVPEINSEVTSSDFETVLETLIH